MNLGKIKSFLKKNTLVNSLIANVYTAIFSPNILLFKACGGGKIKGKGYYLKNVKLKIIGKNNSIVLSEGVRLSNCTIYMHGDNNVLVIEKYGNVTGTTFWLEDDENSIKLGEHFCMGPGQLAAVEGKSICIGSGCLFSYDIEIRTSDSHSIIDKTTSERLNYAQDVVIGDNVWVCAHARILKGAYVAAHSIIGNSSIVGSSCKDPYSIYAGIPAKKIKENINWITHRIS